MPYFPPLNSTIDTLFPIDGNKYKIDLFYSQNLNLNLKFDFECNTAGFSIQRMAPMQFQQILIHRGKTDYSFRKLCKIAEYGIEFHSSSTRNWKRPFSLCVNLFSIEHKRIEFSIMGKSLEWQHSPIKCSFITI